MTLTPGLTPKSTPKLTPKSTQLTPQLTPAQEAALRLDRHVFVEAGAGSGKTTILIQRILSALAQNPDLYLANILAITFTNKAAGELLARLQRQLVSSDLFSDERRHALIASLRSASITTIHGFCATVLAQFPFESGLDPHFSILEPDDGIFWFQDTVYDVTHALLAQKDPRLMTYLSRFTYAQLGDDLMALKSRYQDVVSHQQSIAPLLGVTAEKSHASYEMPEIAQAVADHAALLDALLSIFEECYAAYQEKKQRHSVLDYDDLILKAHHLVAHSPSVAPALRRQYRYILVDEFQDTDRLQWDLIRRIAGRLDFNQSSNLFIVGDIKQSIYGFRGADAAQFSDVQREFSAMPSVATCVTLTDNFRSQSGILDYVNTTFETLFRSSPFPFHALTPTRFDGGMVTPFFYDESMGKLSTQIDYMAEQLLALKSQNPQFSYSDSAILVRKKKDMQAIKEGLGRHGIEVVIHGAKGAWQTDEMADMVCLVKTLLLVHDSLSLIGVLRSPMFAISDDTIAQLIPLFSHKSDRKSDPKSGSKPGSKPDPKSDRESGWESAQESDQKSDQKSAHKSPDAGSLWETLVSVVAQPYDLICNPTADLMNNLANDLATNLANDAACNVNFSVSLRGISESEFERLKQAVSLITRYRYLLSVRSLDQVLHGFCDDSGAWLAYGRLDNGPNRIETIRRFCSKLGQLGVSLFHSGVHIVETLERITRRSADDAVSDLPNPNAVQLMTVHQSKGLEFSVVMVPQLESSLLNRHQRLIFTPNDGIAFGVQLSLIENPRQRDCIQKAIDFQLEEEKRILYVAATRARDTLILLGATPTSSSTTGSSDSRKSNPTYLSWLMELGC